MRRTIIASALLLLASVSVRAQTSATRGLEVSLRFDRTAFMLGEPIAGLLVIRNGDTAPRAIRERLEPEYGACRFDIAAPDAPPRRFNPWIAVDNDRVVTLAPQQQRAVVVKLFFGADGFTFSRPGAYALTATCLGAKSNEVTVSVSQPERDVDRQAAGILFEEPEAGLFMLLDGGDRLQRGRAALARIAEAAPQSRLSAYANVSLGLNASRRSVNLATGEQRAADPAAAERFLTAGDAALRGAGYPLYSLKASSALAETKRALGKMSEFSAIQATISTEMQNLESGAVTDAIREATAPR